MLFVSARLAALHLLSCPPTPHISSLLPALPASRPRGFELFVFVRSIKTKARRRTGGAAPTLDPLCPPCHWAAAAEPSGRFWMSAWVFAACACLDSNWLARSSTMGPSPDSWWVDAAHQLEKQRETRGERAMCTVSVITRQSERWWNGGETREHSLYLYLSKSMLVDCHKWETDRHTETIHIQNACTHTYFLSRAVKFFCKCIIFFSHWGLFKAQAAEIAGTDTNSETQRHKYCVAVYLLKLAC